MTLRTDYNLQTQMDTVFDLGVALIQPTPSATYTIISNELIAAAAAGKEVFTVNIAHNAINDNLELKGTYWDSYKAGLAFALASEDIYDYQFTIELNTASTGVASIDINFSF